MGCDIHSYVESKNEDGTWSRQSWPTTEKCVEGPFDWRSYGMFGFLADVRNYSAVPVIVEPRGLPDDASDEVKQGHEDMYPDAHSASWLTVDELLAFDYTQEFEDRRVTRGNDGGVTAEPGGGEVTTFREFLSPSYFDDLDALREMNEARPTRFVFWFTS